MSEVIACDECDSADLRVIADTDREGEYYCKDCQAEVDGTRREAKNTAAQSLTGLPAFLERADADTFRGEP